jgi:hypothetical protein
MEWVGRIVVFALETVLPGLGGRMLDDRFGIGPVLMLLGFALGMSVGLWHLLAMTASAAKNRKPRAPDDKSREN